MTVSGSLKYFVGPDRFGPTKALRELLKLRSIEAVSFVVIRAADLADAPIHGLKVVVTFLFGVSVMFIPSTVRRCERMRLELLPTNY